MPCRDYESDGWDRSEERRLKQQADRLARIACKAMSELERNGIEDMLVLRDDEVREWWTAHKEADRKRQEAEERAAHRERVRQEALAKLSTEEKEILGIVKPSRKRKKVAEDEDAIDVLEMTEELEDIFQKVIVKKINGGML